MKELDGRPHEPRSEGGGSEALDAPSRGALKAPPAFLGVAVPAHDEEDLVERCLASLHRASSHPLLRRTEVLIVVVADACSDTTAERAAAAGAHVVEIRERNVGMARAAGLAYVLAHAAGRDPATVWLAGTDADSTVPPHWLAGQIGLRARGAEAVAGTVRVADWSGHSDQVRHRFARHQSTLGTGHDHGHVHGANLALSAEAYVAAGGMPHEALAEDVMLWERVRASGRLVVASGGLAVVTSGRHEARATGGFSHLLRSFADPTDSTRAAPDPAQPPRTYADRSDPLPSYLGDGV